MPLRTVRRSRAAGAVAVLVAATALWTAVPAALAAARPAGTAGTAGTAGPSFKLFDDTWYDNENLFRIPGVATSNVVYDSWSISCANTATYSCSLPPQADYQYKIKSIDASIPASSPLTLDFEGIDATSGTPAAEAHNDFLAWQTIVAWTRQVIPSTQPLGVYSYDWDMTPAEIADEAQLHTQGLDFFAPSLYTHTQSLDPANYTSWTSQLDEAVANDHLIAPGQPVYPFIWPQWDTSDSTTMDGASWTAELDYLKTVAQGAIIWGGGRDLDQDSCGWVGATHAFEASVTGQGLDTGSLSADLQLPDTCMLTRGQSVDVPLTITNSGATQNSATPLTVLGASGITATPAQRIVPALLPGSSWTTTVSIDTGSSTLLGDNELTIALGRGSRHVTALVQDTDLALGRPATQSSTDGADAAALAVDGLNTEGLPGGTYSETNADTQAWWQVDLGRTQHIGSIGVTAASGAPDPDNYYVIVSDDPDAAAPTTPIPPNQWIETSPGTWVENVYFSAFNFWQWKGNTSTRGASGPTDIPASLSGRYVKVQLLGTGPLALGQVEVNPGPVNQPYTVSTQRIADGGFNLPTLAPWTTTGTVTTASGPQIGTSAELAPGSTIQQTIMVRPNTTYTLTAEDIVGDSTTSARLGVEGYRGAEESVDASSTNESVDSLTFTTGPHTTSAVVYFDNNAASTGDAYLGSVTVTVAAARSNA